MATCESVILNRLIVDLLCDHTLATLVVMLVDRS